MTRPMPRRPIAALGTAALLLAAALSACGTTSDESSSDAPPPVVTESSDTGADAGTDAGTGSEACTADVATSSDPVTLTDAFDRTVELDKPAQRVAVLEWQQIEDVLSLCVTPVAVADPEGFATWDTAETLPDGVVDVGTRGEPNLDALFKTNPDLVIIEAYTPDDAIIEQLEKYDVPVLTTKGADAADPIAQMKSTFELIAQATGREERAQTVLDEFDAHLADAKTAVAETAGDGTKDFVYFDGYVDGGNVVLRPFGQGSLIGELGEAVGLTNAWTGEVDAAYGLGSTDIEGMTAAGDASLFYTGTKDPTASDDVMTELAKNPVWKALPAVADGRITGFPSGIWTFGGPRSGEQIIDAYVAAVTG